jgi:hypothetical protein
MGQGGDQEGGGGMSEDDVDKLMRDSSRFRHDGEPQRVYFIQVIYDGVPGPIKIGKTKDDPLQRVVYLQTGCPWPLRLVGLLPPSGEHTERTVQAMFTKYNIHGEWFRPEPELIAFIEDSAAITQECIDGLTTTQARRIAAPTSRP